MIRYNMRYRGPYEYDKFVLNVFQFKNDVSNFIDEINNDIEYTSVRDLQVTIDNKLNEITGEYGFSDKVYKKLILMRGE